VSRVCLEPPNPNSLPVCLSWPMSMHLRGISLSFILCFSFFLVFLSFPFSSPLLRARLHTQLPLPRTKNRAPQPWRVPKRPLPSTPWPSRCFAPNCSCRSTLRSRKKQFKNNDIPPPNSPRSMVAYATIPRACPSRFLHNDQDAPLP
jgi:hypothetical protein